LRASDVDHKLTHTLAENILKSQIIRDLVNRLSKRKAASVAVSNQKRTVLRRFGNNKE
jgi:hypothetical protein